MNFRKRGRAKREGKKAQWLMFIERETSNRDIECCRLEANAVNTIIAYGRIVYGHIIFHSLTLFLGQMNIFRAT